MPHTSFESRSSSLHLPIHDFKLSKALRMLCVEALEHSGSIHAAAGKLGITRHALKRRMIKYGIDWPRNNPSAGLHEQAKSPISGVSASPWASVETQSTHQNTPTTSIIEAAQTSESSNSTPTLRIVLESFNLNHAERILCLRALESAGTILDAAQKLGITRHALKRRIIKHEIPWPPTTSLRSQPSMQTPANEAPKFPGGATPGLEAINSLNSLEF